MRKEVFEGVGGEVGGQIHRYIVVGEDDPSGSPAAEALLPLPIGGLGHRLLAILRISQGDYLRDFRRANLCQRRWDPKEAKRSAAKIVLENRERLPVIMLGDRVSQAFGFDFRPFVVYYGVRASWMGPGEDSSPDDLRAIRFACLPHPSGRNRMWNRPDCAESARTAFRGLTE
jgi:uracil-DNA glycosylase